MGIIDALGKGFQTVHRHWWLILIPILLDTFLWIGPRSSVEELVQQTIESVEGELTELSSPEVEDWLDALQVAMGDVTRSYNVFSAVRVATLGIPSLLHWGGAGLSSPSVYEVLWITFLGVADMQDLMVSVDVPTFVGAPVWQIRQQGIWLLLSLLLTGIGMIVGSLYLTSISRSLEESEDDAPFWSRALQLGKRVVLFWILRAVVLAILGIPFLLVVLMLGALSSALAVVFSTVALGMVTWAAFYGIYLVPSLAVNRSSLWRALWNSYNIVLRNFWPTLWLFLLINLIGGGLSILWSRMSTGSWLTWVAIVGNAYVGTSLVAGSLVFYRDRYQRWQRAIADLLSRRPTRTA